MGPDSTISEVERDVSNARKFNIVAKPVVSSFKQQHVTSTATKVGFSGLQSGPAMAEPCLGLGGMLRPTAAGPSGVGVPSIFLGAVPCQTRPQNVRSQLKRFESTQSVHMSQEATMTRPPYVESMLAQMFGPHAFSEFNPLKR